MKKHVKKLTIGKKTISSLNGNRIVGGAAPNNNNDAPVGPDKEPATLLAQGCGTSLRHSDCICGTKTYFDETCGSCYY